MVENIAVDNNYRYILSKKNTFDHYCMDCINSIMMYIFMKVLVIEL